MEQIMLPVHSRKSKFRIKMEQAPEFPEPVVSLNRWIIYKLV